MYILNFDYFRYCRFYCNLYIFDFFKSCKYFKINVMYVVNSYRNM